MKEMVGYKEGRHTVDNLGVAIDSAVCMRGVLFCYVLAPEFGVVGDAIALAAVSVTLDDSHDG
jgi:hypothetical protein